MKIINFEKKNMASLTSEQKESYKETKICYICQKKKVIIIERKCTKDKNYRKVKDHCHYTGIQRCCTQDM